MWTHLHRVVWGVGALAFLPACLPAYMLACPQLSHLIACCLRLEGWVPLLAARNLAHC